MDKKNNKNHKYYLYYQRLLMILIINKKWLKNSNIGNSNANYIFNVVSFLVKWWDMKFLFLSL